MDRTYHVSALRRAHAIAMAKGPAAPVDADLAKEAGMDGNYAHLLQAARDLDTSIGHVFNTPAPSKE